MSTIETVASFHVDLDDPRSNYFTMAIVLLPSILAVTIPVLPNSQNDLAVLATDTLIIIVITWIIKFVIEWPWNWLKQIEVAKTNILNNTNSRLLMKPELKLELHENITNLKRLQSYEMVALGICVGGIFVCSMLMVLTRNYIIVEESRKNIVFNNLNIGLFITWGGFKVILVILNKVKNKCLCDNEYGLINDGNLDSLGEVKSPPQIELKTSSPQIELQKEQAPKEPSESMVLLEKYRIELESVKKEVQVLESVKNQVKVIKELVERNINFDDKLRDSQFLDNKLRGQGRKSFIRPFPLNFSPTPRFDGEKYNRSKNLNGGTEKFNIKLTNSQNGNIKQISPQNGNIKQINYQNANTKPHDNSLTNDFSESTTKFEAIKSSLETIFEEENEYSLHGIPCSSKFKQLITHKQHPNIEDYKSDQIETTIIHTRTETVAELFKQLVKVIYHIITTYSLRQIMTNPMNINVIITREIVPLLIQIDNSILGINQGLETLKTLGWELSNKHVFSNFAATINYLDSFPLNGLKQCWKAYIYITIKIPWKVVTSGLAIVLFIPRIFIQIFIVYPFLQSSNLNLREFHLNRKNEFPSDFKTKRLVANQLARKLNVVEISDPTIVEFKPLIDP